MLERIKLAALAAFGNRRAQGQLNVLDVVARLKGDWSRYRGEQDCGRTVRDLSRFFSDVYGVSLSRIDAGPLALGGPLDVFDPGHEMSKQQLDKIWVAMARELIRQGAISFERQDGQNDRGDEDEE